ncbi:phage coat protein [Nitrosomonas oligotropha]|uniref:Bacteriophage coat protein B n=1 Tax=Nitrosomonas oligotropha TaxID=42354 RepID=A0A1H8RML1_9PROT|nr:phage coat protein [Nitrosomonas oligotropha]SDX03154.1 Bacteriophage coat protein B [Nitrosomonas oligotropha]SEO67572.1 Bacteriophage coat protein B [Nitrosomonas oligotropha]
MFQTIKNLYRKSVDAVTAIGRNIKSFFSPAIEGEYIGKGDIMRRSFNPRGSLAYALTFCFLMLPAISFAAVPADVTTAITTAATDVATVGAAVIIVMVGIKVWKWIQRAL